MAESQIPQSVLLNNLSIVKTIADAVRGTFGPQGLDVMMIDEFGDYTITNDGVKILSLIETSHPAAKMLIDAAKTQEEEVGDGTTTVTILVDAILSEAVKQVEKGVPIPKLIEGIKLGLSEIQETLTRLSVPIKDLNDQRLREVAIVAGRGEKEIVDLILQATQEIRLEKLLDKDFKFSKIIIGQAQAQSELIKGIIINKNRVNAAMPSKLKQAKVLIIDDELFPEELPQEAVRTEQGFAQFQKLQQDFLKGIQKIISLGAKLILIDSKIHPYAEELFVENGVMAVQRIRNSEIQRAALYCGAKLASRRTLSLPDNELQKYFGEVDSVIEDEKLGIIRLEGSHKESMSTLIIGAGTSAVAAEKERIATDIASAVQATLRGGIVAGGGAIELALIPSLEELKKAEGHNLSLTHYGIDCLIEALKKPLAQISSNLGLNPLEKVAQVLAAQSSKKDFTLGINANNGELNSMLDLGVIDPTLVKSAALRTACEVAIQLLKMNVIIRSRQIEGS